jgi:glyoxylase-like metal-dependent hydrolase (beta-lactamase superfamily II)
MKVEIFFDAKRTKTATFVVTDTKTNRCAIVDPILDYDQASGKTYTQSIDKVIKFITINDLKLDWILETHIHADHLTSSQYIKEKIGGKIAIGENIKKVLEYWKPVFGDDDIQIDGSQFDQLFKDGDTFKIGSIDAKVIYTPGHTPACVSYHIDDYLFTGDTIFSPLVGTARTDFPGGSSSELFDSVQKIYQLPNETRICVGHEYPVKESDPIIITTIGEEKKNNISINENTKKEDYVARMNARQVNLPVPQLIFPSLQVNLRAGKLPKYIKILLNLI